MCHPDHWAHWLPSVRPVPQSASQLRTACWFSATFSIIRQVRLVRLLHHRPSHQPSHHPKSAKYSGLLFRKNILEIIPLTFWQVPTNLFGLKVIRRKKLKSSKKALFQAETGTIEITIVTRPRRSWGGGVVVVAGVWLVWGVVGRERPVKKS